MYLFIFEVYVLQPEVGDFLGPGAVANKNIACSPGPCRCCGVSTHLGYFKIEADAARAFDAAFAYLNFPEQNRSGIMAL